MTDKIKSPSRMAGYAETMRGLVARDGLVCFLCGHKHATVHTMQGDMRNPDNGFELDNLVIACKPCAKRRNGKRIGAYWRERMSAAASEIAHINMMAANQETLRALSDTLSLVPHAVDGTGHTEPVEAKPWENLAQPVRVFNYDRLTDAEYVAGWPAEWLEPQHGDVYQEVTKDYVFDSADQKWVTLEAAQERGEFPEDWPPADAVQHGL